LGYCDFWGKAEGVGAPIKRHPLKGLNFQEVSFLNEKKAEGAGLNIQKVSFLNTDLWCQS
jgi:hypothetical protein